MSTKEEQYNIYCKWLHVERIKQKLICFDRLTNYDVHVGNLINLYKPFDKSLYHEETIECIGELFDECQRCTCNICHITYCDAEKNTHDDDLYDKYIKCYTARGSFINYKMKHHIKLHHYEYCYSCDNCFDFFVSIEAYYDHCCK